MRQMTALDQNAVAALLFAAVASLVGLDLMSDVGSGVDGLHVGAEGAAAVLALVGAGLFYRHHRLERRETAAWRARANELLVGLGGTVARQFDDWSLSTAEREVGLLLLKGLSFKEIGAVRGTSERTGREQARAIYKKAGVAGRAELSAWFIEDLLAEPVRRDD